MENENKNPTEIDLQLLLDNIEQDGKRLGMSDQQIKRLQEDCIKMLENKK